MKVKCSVYVRYIKKCFKMLWQLHNEEKLSICSLLIDYTWCLIRHGCLIRHYVIGNFYKRREFERRRILTYRRYLKVQHYFNKNENIHILENKHEFNSFFSEYVHRKWLYSPEMSFDDFLGLFKDKKELIVKPYNTCEGEGVYKIYFEKLGEEGAKIIYNKLKTSKYMIEECVLQAPVLSLGSTSVNTLRVETLLDKKTKKSHIVKALFRAGVGHTDIDNYAQGGCVYEVDLSTGRIISSALSKVNNNAIFHPKTNTCMLGFKIPHWEEVVKVCNYAQEKLPTCGFIGWDVAILCGGGIELIEGNHNPDYELLEFKGTYRYWEKIKPYMY